MEAYINKDVLVFLDNYYKFDLFKNSVDIKNIFLIEYLYNMAFWRSNSSANVGYSIYLLFPVMYFYYKRKNKTKNSEIIFSKQLLLIGIISALLSTKLFPWNLFQDTLYFIQFPWRLLIVASCFIPLSIGIYSKYIKRKKAILIYLVCILISLLCSTVLLLNYMIRPGRTITLKEEIGLGEYLYKGVNNEVTRKLKIELPINNYLTNNDKLIFSYNKQGKTIEIDYSNNNKTDTYIEVPLFNYKGYKANGATISDGNNGLIRINLNNEKGHIKVFFDMTTVQKISYIISLVTILLTLSYLIYKKRNT